MRWVLLDEVVEIEKGVQARSRSRVPAAEGNPETLMIEMMAQTGGMLLGAESNFADDVVFTKIESADFDAGFNAGDPLEISARAEGLRPEGAWFDGEIRSAGGSAAHCRFMLMAVNRLVPGRTESVTFHPAFMNHFHIREKVR